ncbi:MAG: hypothetical protein IJ724_04815 [Muribaculaceae bacterium]|nr:hypothetical protein [Muribaculaceae bacterium]
MVAFLIILITLYLRYKATPWLLAWWLRRRQHEFQEQVGQAYEQATRQQQARQRAEERSSHIEDNAEDAEFQEIAGQREMVVEETFEAEQQIVDAEFEDI